MNIFKIKGLYAGYRKFTVLKNINMEIADNDFISIIGPNGAGKSTFIKVLSRDILPSKGELLFKGKPLLQYKSQDIAREFSIVHQFKENVMPFSVYEFIRLGRFPHQKLFEIENDKDKESIEDAIAVTGISNLRNRILSELSGGELQLVFIAHSLAQNSNIIMLDEPVSHLDIKHSIQIMDILYDLNQKGSTIITILHDINLSSDYCSKIIGIKNGKIFSMGKPEDVIKYDLIEELYDTTCIITDNPLSGKPYAYPVPGYLQK